MRIKDVRPQSFVFQLHCDRCGAEAQHNVDDGFNNFLQIEFDTSWGSDLGDGIHVELDICHACLKETLGSCLRMSPAAWANPKKVCASEDFREQVETLSVQNREPISNAATANQTLEQVKSGMRADAERWVMGGTVWLTSTELLSDMPKKPLDCKAMLTRWVEEGKIFALERDGIQIYPRYAFNCMLEPVPSLRVVLQVMEGRSPFQIAAWFESPSSSLGGKRPREMLLQDGVAVVVAAHRLMEGPIHG